MSYCKACWDVSVPVTRTRRDVHSVNVSSLCVLSEEVQEHVSRAARRSERTTELEGLLDGVKTRVQDLEDCYLHKAAQQRSQTQQLQREKEDAQVRRLSSTSSDDEVLYVSWANVLIQRALKEAVLEFLFIRHSRDAVGFWSRSC